MPSPPEARGSMGTAVVAFGLILTLELVDQTDAQSTSATTTSEPNESGNRYGRITLIIGLTIALLVMIVLAIAVVYLFWFAPIDEGQKVSHYNVFHPGIYDEASGNGSGNSSPPRTPIQNSWVDTSPRRLSVGSTGSRSRLPSWQEEAADVTDDIITRLGITVEESDGEDEVQRKRRGSKSKRRRGSRSARRNSGAPVTRFSPSEGTEPSPHGASGDTADGSADDDDDIITTRLHFTASHDEADNDDNGEYVFPADIPGPDDTITAG
eukprot:CAMPEP_0182931238 /NCGR_PEP_ID=MMETSP0105_2-20130417/27776_1 /TAXON_ID=81532 ORGANISM="Acanthoeca-like sp., Strain 10tr" /NCGR_SAMPLE_ID=MMETSP0105_2 /ASSEMBLY_ACC=CAM_ASM_000205 /LENGTH=266 /DNA_ID=CAMNT_0025069643 /DNA_START=114 /DNA_END=911 /DNA_ORIENTATION=+